MYLRYSGASPPQPPLEPGLGHPPGITPPAVNVQRNCLADGAAPRIRAPLDDDAAMPASQRRCRLLMVSPSFTPTSLSWSVFLKELHSNLKRLSDMPQSSLSSLMLQAGLTVCSTMGSFKNIYYDSRRHRRMSYSNSGSRDCWKLSYTSGLFGSPTRHRATGCQCPAQVLDGRSGAANPGAVGR